MAGIATAGNPAARVLVARITFDYRLVPELPTIELAQAWARAYRETVDYFRKSGVRVVNMSWGGTAEWYERALEKHNAGGNPEERKVLARAIFDIEYGGLREAIASVPEILFVPAAGNLDEDNRFVEDAPGSFDLPNLITVAAVDRAGDEAAFTSYGKVEVYANGYEVESYLPGGERHALSGTSMAAPQVVNLAAKLLAVYPELTVAHLREAIVVGADERAIGEAKKIRLLNPRRSFEIVAKRFDAGGLKNDEIISTSRSNSVDPVFGQGITDSCETYPLLSHHGEMIAGRPLACSDPVADTEGHNGIFDAVLWALSQP